MCMCRFYFYLAVAHIYRPMDAQYKYDGHILEFPGCYRSNCSLMEEGFTHIKPYETGSQANQPWSRSLTEILVNKADQCCSV